MRPLIDFLHGKWFFRICYSVAAGLLLLAIGKFTQREWIRSEGETELAAAIAETEKADPNWRWDDLNAKRTRPPEGRNGADLLPIIKKQTPKDWGKKLLSEEWEAERNVPANARYSKEVIAEVRRECIAAKDAIATARRFKDYPFGFHSVELAPNPISTLIPYVQDARSIPMLLRWDVVLAVEDGDSPQTADTLLAMLNGSRSIGSDPLEIPQIVRRITRGLATRSLEWAMAQGELPEDRLALLQTAWASDAEEPLLLYAALGERASSDVLIFNLQSGAIEHRDFVGKDDEESTLGRLGWWGYRVRLSADRAQILRQGNQWVEFARKPIEEQVRARSTLRVPEIDEKHKVAAILIAMSDSGLTTLARAQWRSVAEMRCAAVGIACERFRLKHGRWPEALAKLAPDYLPAVPLDPFDGKPLKMKSLADGVVIYSIGADGDDNGGVLRRDSNIYGRDEGFRLWNVKDRRVPPPPRPKPSPDDEP